MNHSTIMNNSDGTESIFNSSCEESTGKCTCLEDKGNAPADFSAVPEHDQTDYVNQFKLGDIVSVVRSGNLTNYSIGIVKKVYEKGNLFLHLITSSGVPSSSCQGWNRYGISDKTKGYYTRNDDRVTKLFDPSTRMYIREECERPISQITFGSGGSYEYLEYKKHLPRETYTLYANLQHGRCDCPSFAVMRWTKGKHESWSNIIFLGDIGGLTKDIVNVLNAQTQINYLSKIVKNNKESEECN